MKRSTYNCLNCGTENIWTHSKSNKYCNNSCQAQHRTQIRTLQWLNEGKDWTTNIPGWAKNYLAQQRGYACEVCGISEWNSTTIALECDHIDGHHSNNKPENLRLICPNCHSQTATYKNKNKGNGRDYRQGQKL